MVYDAKLEPRGCKECPFQYDGIHCQAPGSMVRHMADAAYLDGHAPPSCPLREGPIEIRMESIAFVAPESE